MRDNNVRIGCTITTMVKTIIKDYIVYRFVKSISKKRPSSEGHGDG